MRSTPGLCHSSLDGAPVKIHAAHASTGQGAPGQIIEASKDGLKVACGEGSLILSRLQLPGGKALAVSDVFNSRREQFAVGKVFE